jgi:hypothetical protein
MAQIDGGDCVMIKTGMLFSFAAIALGVLTMPAIATDMPRLDVSRTCRAESSGQKATADSCMADEQKAQEQLTREWSQFAVDIRRNCASEATGIAGIQSYVELLTCIQMAIEAKKLPKQ